VGKYETISYGNVFQGAISGKKQRLSDLFLT
jgi:hypothetical protein